MLMRFIGVGAVFFCFGFRIASADVTAVAQSTSLVGPPLEEVESDESMRCSLIFSLPNGGSMGTTTAAGARCFVWSSVAPSLFLQAGYDRVLERTIFGGIFRTDFFLSQNKRAKPFLFIQGNTGQTKSTKKDDNDTGDATTGAALGGGVEVEIIPEISISGDIGMASNFAPTDKLNATTFASSLMLHLYF